MLRASGIRFALEGLEDRKLLSASVVDDLLASSPDLGLSVNQAAVLASPTIASSSIVTPARKTVPATTPLTGVFNVAGTYSHPITPGFNPDAGNRYDFTGAGKKRSLGRFTMTGYLQLPGFIASGQARGRVTFGSSQGTLDVRLIGPPQTPGSLPPTLAYKIMSGTGVYANASGKGTITLSASDTTQKFVFQFNQA